MDGEIRVGRKEEALLPPPPPLPLFEIIIIIPMTLNTTQVEISKGYAVSDWRDDVRRCLLGAGLKNKPTTFLFR